MLALTPTASEAVDVLVSQGEGAAPGLRISSVEETVDGSGPGAELRLAIVPEPSDGDLEIEGSPVYVQPGPVADLVDDKILDADVEGQTVRFLFVEGTADTT